MSGWNDADKLALARAAHYEFTGRSPNSRGHGASVGKAGGTGRGRGGASPSPARNFDNPGNNMATAGRGRGGHHTFAGGGRGGRNGSAAVSSTHGIVSSPVVQKTDAQNSNKIGGYGPMELDQPAWSSMTAVNASSIDRSMMAAQIANSSGALKGTQEKLATNSSGGPMDLDNSKRVQSHTTSRKPEGPKRGLMSSLWATDPAASDTGNTGTDARRPSNVVSANSFGNHMESSKENSKNAQIKGGTNHGLFGSRWARSPSPPSTSPSDLAPVYKSNNWIEDLEKENEAEAKRRAALASVAVPRTAHGNSSGPNLDPAVRAPAAHSAGALAQTRANHSPSQDATANTAFSGNIQQPSNDHAQRAAQASSVSMQNQSYTQRPSAIQFGNQPSGQQSIGSIHRPVGAAHPTASPAQAYQPAAVRTPTQGQPQQAQDVNALPVGRAYASPNGKSIHRGGSGVTSSLAGFGAGSTAHPQQPYQPIGGKVGQQPSHSTQQSDNPFNDESFKHFWENEYMRNNR